MSINGDFCKKLEWDRLCVPGYKDWKKKPVHGKRMPYETSQDLPLAQTQSAHVWKGQALYTEARWMEMPPTEIPHTEEI